MKNWAVRLSVGLFLLLTTEIAVATDIKFDGDPIQGSLLWARAPMGTSHVTANKRRIPVTKDQKFIFAIGRDETAPIRITAYKAEIALADRVIVPITRDYDIQRIDGLPSKKVSPDPATLERIGREASLIKAVRARTADTSRFPIGFNWPVTGRISGVFGSQRILNGKPRSPHRGVDVAAPEGTPVLAPADGVVRLVHEDMFYTGKTVMLDHGYGVTSVYVHLSDISVKNGQILNAGVQLGNVGQTGRATGPHLHWGISWYGVHVDPTPLAGPMPE